MSDQISSVEQVPIEGESHVIMIDEACGRDHGVVQRDGRLAGDRDQGRLAEEQGIDLALQHLRYFSSRHGKYLLFKYRLEGIQDDRDAISKLVSALELSMIVLYHHRSLVDLKLSSSISWDNTESNN